MFGEMQKLSGLVFISFLKSMGSRGFEQRRGVLDFPGSSWPRLPLSFPALLQQEIENTLSWAAAPRHIAIR